MAQQKLAAAASTDPLAKAQIYHAHNDRIFYATLLALREVLAQNAERFFALPKVRDDNNDDGLSNEDIEEEDAFGKLMLATSIVLAACQNAGKDEDLLLKYIQDDDFPADRATHLTSLQALSGGSVVVPGDEESVAFKVGYNVALAKRAAAARQIRTSIPEVTACWMSVVEEIPSNMKKILSSCGAS